MKAQAVLSVSPALATIVGERLFPPEEAGLIAELIRRDAPFYAPEVSPDAIAGLTAFARRTGLQKGDVMYNEIVDESLAPTWAAGV